MHLAINSCADQRIKYNPLKLMEILIEMTLKNEKFRLALGNLPYQDYTWVYYRVDMSGIVLVRIPAICYQHSKTDKYNIIKCKCHVDSILNPFTFDVCKEQG